MLNLLRRPAVTPAELDEGLRALGLDGSQHVIVHASLKSFGTLDGGARKPKFAEKREVDRRRAPNAASIFARAGASIIAAATEGAQLAMTTRAETRSSLSPARRAT